MYFFASRHRLVRRSLTSFLQLAVGIEVCSDLQVRLALAPTRGCCPSKAQPRPAWELRSDH
jgi:hypothetical protein